MLEINNLSVSYGHVQALRNVSLSVGSHEVVALVGNNGAGKTTTLKAISGLLKPAAGSSIVFQGQSLVGMAPHKIAALGVVHVPEGRKIFYKLTVRENLMMGALTQKDKQKNKETLETVLATFPILKERFKQQGGTLSGGEQQMLAVGRAMMAGPKILLMDEPSLGLAPLIVETIAQQIVRIAKTGIPILLVEQNANLALAISQRAYVLETGLIEITGNSAELAGNDTIQKAYMGMS